MGHDRMLQPFFTAKSKVMGERAATQIGGWGFCTGLGTEGEVGNDQNSPSCA